MRTPGNAPWIKRWLSVILIGCSLNLANCTTKPAVVVLPDSRLLIRVYDDKGQPVPDYYGMSAGYLRDLLQQIEACK